MRPAPLKCLGRGTEGGKNGGMTGIVLCCIVLVVHCSLLRGIVRYCIVLVVLLSGERHCEVLVVPCSLVRGIVRYCIVLVVHCSLVRGIVRYCIVLVVLVLCLVDGGDLVLRH